MSVRIIIDSAADLDAAFAAAHDVRVVPLTISFSNEEFLEGVDITRDEFYTRLPESDELPRTSQIPPYKFQEIFAETVAAGDTAVVITLSSKLSGTYQSACIAAAPFKDAVFVVDSRNASLGQHIIVERAINLRDEGRSAADIAERLERERDEVVLVAALNTLEYLKKGGRISGAAALVGGLLSIKPVIGVDADGSVVMFGKARGTKQAKALFYDVIRKSGGIDFTRPIQLAYTGLANTHALKFLADAIDEAHANGLVNVPMLQAGAVIGTHVGPEATGIAFFAKPC